MMTFDEAKDVFLNRGWIPIENGTIFDANKWRESVAVISKWLEQEPCEDWHDVLDKIIAEIKALSPEPTAYDVVDGNPIKDAVWETIIDVLKIIDKYKAESEDKDGK